MNARLTAIKSDRLTAAARRDYRVIARDCAMVGTLDRLERSARDRRAEYAEARAESAEAAAECLKARALDRARRAAARAAAQSLKAAR